MSKFNPFLWPDHVIGKRESRRIRDEHNALYNSHAELLEALKDLWWATSKAEGLTANAARNHAAKVIAKATQSEVQS